MTTHDDARAPVNLIAETEIRDVRLVRVDAEVSLVPAEMQVKFKSGGARINKSDDEIVVQFEHSAEFSTPEGEHAAKITLGHSARFSYSEGLELDEESVGHWVFGNVYFMVYPYVRQSLQDTCLRLGLPAVVLGYLKRGEMAPESITMVVTSTAFQHSDGEDEPLPLEEAQA